MNRPQLLDQNLTIEGRFIEYVSFVMCKNVYYFVWRFIKKLPTTMITAYTTK